MSLACTVGDTDSHSGTVVSGSDKTFIHGAKAATDGSSVSGDSMPHSGKVVTASGASTKTFVGGRALAIQGTLVNCGASLIASGSKTFAG